VPIKVEIPSPLDPPNGCALRPRCAHAMANCRTPPPELESIAPHRRSACLLDRALP
jgi:oligopeptide/dipeptide ABC transporter ATP-binding protein